MGLFLEGKAVVHFTSFLLTQVFPEKKKKIVFPCNIKLSGNFVVKILD